MTPVADFAVSRAGTDSAILVLEQAPRALAAAVLRNDNK